MWFDNYQDRQQNPWELWIESNLNTELCGIWAEVWLTGGMLIQHGQGLGLAHNTEEEKEVKQTKNGIKHIPDGREESEDMQRWQQP